MSILEAVRNFFGVRSIEKSSSKYNREIDVIKGQGQVRIVVGNFTQSGRFVDQIWRGGLKQIQRNSNPPKSVLIIGLGGGTVANLIQDIWPTISITGIEIDAEMVRLGKKYLGLKETKRLNVIIGDALQVVPQLKKEFDLILVDVYIGGKIPARVQGNQFTNSVLKLLSPGGTVIFNRLFHNDQEKENAEKFIKTLEKKLDLRLSRQLSNLLIIGKRKQLS